MLEIVELDPNGLLIALSLQHVGRPRPA
jgi:hypothetical protein